MAAPNALLVMGVSGSGKSTVGALLASELGWKFYDADDYHPEENRMKMQKGIALNDKDRIPWLCKLHDILRRLLCPWDSPGKNTGVRCHALLQEILSTQGSNPCLFRLLHWQADSLLLAPPGEAKPSHRIK